MMMGGALKAVLTLFSVTLVLAQQQHFATNERIALTPAVRKFIDDTRLDPGSEVVGLSVAVIHPDGRVELEGFGNKTELGEGAGADTLFVLGSTSKAFAAASLGILIDDFARGKNVTSLPDGLETFDWHTKVKDLLPGDWKLKDEWASEKASVRDVLAHVSGLSRHDLQYQRNDSARDVVRRLRHLRPTWELREQYHYNNQMYILASHIIATYSGLPFTQFVKQRIFTPLRMSTTTYSQTEASERGLLTQFFNAEGRRIPFWYPEHSEEMIAGAGGVISSVHDLVEWVKLHLNGGVDPVSNETIISKSSFEAVTSGWSLMSHKGPSPGRSFEAYGHGWSRHTRDGHEIVSHDGGLPGTSSQVAFLPGDGVGVVVLSNTSNRGTQTSDILYRILEELFGISRATSESTTSNIVREAPASPTKQTNDGEKGLPIDSYAGVYYDPAYYNITFCDPHVPSSAENAKCQQLFEDFNNFEDVKASNDTLYVSLSSFWTHQARLRRIQGNHFQLQPTFLFPGGYGLDTSPLELFEAGSFNSSVEFVVEDGRVVGFALDSSDVDPAQIFRERGVDVMDAADVWFDKVV
ncbi:beta-lactamase/transpeptidase-like protein [Irpex lacteus]|nr:beta-lactamase/transpeptidase-like protein [Irpex lacteus]